jgi:hypothetical protein
MISMNEAFARERMREAQQSAEHSRMVRQASSARRWRRRERMARMAHARYERAAESAASVANDIAELTTPPAPEHNAAPGAGRRGHWTSSGGRATHEGWLPSARCAGAPPTERSTGTHRSAGAPIWWKVRTGSTSSGSVLTARAVT